MDTPTPAALLILLQSPLCTNHAAQQPGGRQVLSSASGELKQQWKAHGQGPCSWSCSLHGGSPAAPRAGLWTVLPRLGWCSPEESSPGLQWLEVMPVAAIICLLSLVKLKAV